MVDNGVAKGSEAAGVAEGVGFDGVEDFGKRGVEVKGAIVVGVTEVFDVFGEVAEQEDVGFPDLAGDFNLLGESVRARRGLGRGDLHWHHRMSQ